MYGVPDLSLFLVFSRLVTLVSDPLYPDPNCYSLGSSIYFQLLPRNPPRFPFQEKGKEEWPP